MRRLVPIALAVAALIAVPAAAAKGPSAARITGPGLAAAIALSGNGEPGAPTTFGTLVDGLGFFPSSFGQDPSPMLPGRPTGELGPRYTVRYAVPGPNRTVHVEQELYPYARGGPVTFMRPGQALFPGVTTRGGWFRGPDAVEAALVKSGLPASAPGGHDGLGTATWILLFTGILAAGGLVLAALMRIRRRPEPSPA